MKNTLSLVLILMLAAGSACAVIAGKEDDSGQQQPLLNLRFVESLRSERSLQGEGWKEPQLQSRNIPPAALEQLQQPNSVYADAFRVYVTDTYTSSTIPSPTPIRYPRVFVFERGSRTMTSLSIPTPPAEGSLLAPSAIAVDPTNVILVADSQQGKVFGYDRTGRLLFVFGKAGDLGKPSALAVDQARDRLYIADAAANQVKVFRIAEAAAGQVNVFTAFGNNLFTLGGSGKASEDFTFPRALALDRAGNLYVLDSHQGRVYVYGPDGRFIKRFALSGETLGGPVKPRGIAVDSDGHVYAPDMVSNNILVFDKDGAFLQTWGRSGSLPGDFLTPAGIFIDDRDMIYIADQMNGRVQVFQYSK